MEFTGFNLHPDLLRGISEAGYVTCMPVQEQVLTHAFNGQDLYVQSQTGTGKTAAFLIVVFQRLLSEELLHGKKAIIMVPTRELAVQVEEEAKLLGKYLPFKVGSFYGGVGYSQQKELLRDNAQILVGTPGRVLDLNQSGQMNLMDIAFLVLDEADRMFDMGFYPDLRKLIKVVPPADRRQTMLFSATLNAWVKNLAWEYTKTPYEIEIEPETVTVEEVEQILYHVSSGDKMKLLLGILAREQPESAIIFCNTKRYAEVVAKRMKINGYNAEFIIGDLPQVKRLKIIDDIKSAKLHYLVATDVAARGLDIEGLALVVNFDVPNETENYVHRIGRTARAGKTGKAITLASEQDVYELPSIERYIGQKIPSETIIKELLVEDKSEGQRIHTDFYEERGDRRNGSRGERRGEGRQGSRDRGRGREGRDHQLRRGGEHRSGEARSGVERNEGRRRDGGNAPGGRDISKLSFDERMAYYKQKYNQGGAEGKGRKPHNRDRGGEEGSVRNKRREAGEAILRPEGGRGKDAAGARNRRGKGDQRRSGRKESGAKPAEAAGGKPAVPAAVKDGDRGASGKGVLSKILGIFKKKKE
jgi:ATP-dependent RNA helicase RhlB